MRGGDHIHPRTGPEETGDEKDGEYLTPDPRHQRWVLLGLALVAAASIWSLTHLVNELDAARAMSLKSVRSAALQTIEVAGAYFRWLAAFLGLFGAVLVIRGLRIAQSRRYPPPGAWIVRRTRIRRGARAHLRALLTVLVGLFLVVLAYSFPPWADAQLAEVLAGALQTPDLPPGVFSPE